MYAYPKQSEFNRVLPKNLIYKNAKPSNAVKNAFVSEVEEIRWQYKLSRETVNLAPKGGIMEIQIFAIRLKVPEPGKDILKTIDRAIPYPIFYRLYHEDRVNRVTAFKKTGATDGGKVVISDYFETGWQADNDPAVPLPVALDMENLYKQMIVPYIGVPLRENESLEELVHRAEILCRKERELTRLEKKLATEKQFRLKVEINSQIRELQAAYKRLQ